MTGLFPIAVFAQTTGPVYVVQEGDNLYLIAQRFGTSVEAIAGANNITDPSIIVPGSELIIPGYEGVSGILDFHELEFGETLTSLSSRYELPLEAMVKLNRILNPGRLYIGQALVVTVSEQEEMNPNLQVLLARESESKLAFAARNGVSPWELKDLTKPLERAWIIPFERLVIPGEEELLHSLPIPIKQVEVNPKRGIQGHTIVITVRLDGSNPIRGQIGQQQLNFHGAGSDQFIALQGILALIEPGMYDLEIQVLDQNGAQSVFSFSQPMRIASGQYGYDPVLYVPEETIDSEKTSSENELIASIVNQVSEEKYWEGTFLFPTSYTDAFPSYFGSRRNYNNQGYDWYHSGLDLYGGTGTPIMAPAKGKVVFAGSLAVRGNVTFIDHGWGVFTGYLHQSSIEVSLGDWVEPEQVIGYVGATGRVTGPHLHWEIWVGGVPVDPLEWTSQAFP